MSKRQPGKGCLLIAARTLILCLALMGFLFAYGLYISPWFSHEKHTIDNIPTWLSAIILICISCYAVIEIGSLYSQVTSDDTPNPTSNDNTKDDGDNVR